MIAHIPHKSDDISTFNVLLTLTSVYNLHLYKFGIQKRVAGWRVVLRRTIFQVLAKVIIT